MKNRLLGATALLSLSSMVGATVVATSASAASSQSSAPAVSAARRAGSVSTSIPCTINTVADTCTLTVTRFAVVNGALVAFGTVTGGGITVPFQAPVQTNASAVQAAQAAPACSILDLTLG